MGIKTGFNQGNASELIRSMPRQQRKGDVIDVMDDVLERTDGGTDARKHKSVTGLRHPPGLVLTRP